MLADLWKDVQSGAKENTNHAYDKYVKGVSRAPANQRVSKLTLKQAYNQLMSAHRTMVTHTKPKERFKTRKHILHYTPKWLQSFTQKSVSHIQKKSTQGLSATSHVLFHKRNPEDITLQNVLHLYFGAIALGGATSGTVEGVRHLLFDSVQTSNSLRLAKQMHAVSVTVPESFYLED